MRGLIYCLSLALCVPSFLFGTTVIVDEQVPFGELAHNQEMGFHSETFVLPKVVLDTLKAECTDEVLFAAFPSGPGNRAMFELRRFDPYAKNAVITVIRDGVECVTEKSVLHFYLGVAVDDLDTRIGLSVSPETGEMKGVVIGPDSQWAGHREYVIESVGNAKNGSSDTLVTIRMPEMLELENASKLSSSCGGDQMPLGDLSMEGIALATHREKTLATDVLYYVTVAVDTDADLLWNKFGNDTTAATDWIAQLFVQSNVIYERDIATTALQGTTFLRVDADGPPFDTDPYSVSGSPATISHLNEFASYWLANYSGGPDNVDRTFALMLSGKSDSDTSSSGIAYVDGFCENQVDGGGYAYDQVFIAGWIPVTSDVRVAAHELGHNMGSPHTHCYLPEIDQCFGSEAGCYQGAVSCPPVTLRGTLMSYCHLSIVNGGPNCGANLLEMHPDVAWYIEGYMQAHYGWCVQPPPTLFSDGFESGDMSAWSTSVP